MPNTRAAPTIDITALRRCAAWLAGLALCTIAAPAAAQGTPTSDRVLRIGVLPNISARVLFANYEPFVRYIERTNGRPSELATAPNFKAFHENTVRGDYDLVITAANLGRVAELQGGLVSIAVYEPSIIALAITAKDRPLKSINDLRGKTVALSNPQSLVALAGHGWLRAGGLLEGKDYKTLHTPNDDSLGLALRSGETPLAIMSTPEFRQIGEDVKKDLTIFESFATVPGFFVLTKTKERGGDPEAMKNHLAAFAASKEGQQFFGTTGLKAIRPITDADRASVDPYVDPTRRRLAAPD